MLLARLFALPANVLVLDEPTNDLDIDTLELLEELLQSYAGTVFLVSHDRRFLDNVVTSTIAWEGDVARRAAGASTKAATRTGSCSASARARLALQAERAQRRAGAEAARPRRPRRAAAPRQAAQAQLQGAARARRAAGAHRGARARAEGAGRAARQRRALRRRSGPGRAGADARRADRRRADRALERWELLSVGAAAARSPLHGTGVPPLMSPEDRLILRCGGRPMPWRPVRSLDDEPIPNTNRN